MTRRSTRNPMRARWGAALAVGIAVAASGCAPRYVTMAPPTGGERYKGDGAPNPKDPYVFAVVEDADGCPVDADVDFKNCPEQAKGCVRVKGGQTVRFQSRSNRFLVLFDPFGRSPIGADGTPLDLTAQTSPTPGKPHTFVIRSDAPSCKDKVVDPQIILD